MERRELIFKAMSWVFEDRETDMVIHVSGMTKEGKTVQIQIEKFTPYCYLQLPKRITWTKEKCRALFQHFVSKYKSKGPLNYSLKKKKNLYFLKEGNYMLLTFSTNDACRGFERKCISKQYISGVGMINDMELLVHEHNIDPILKIASMKNILLSGWVKVVETIPEGEEDLSEEDRKFSYADIDMYVHYQDISFFDMKEHVIVTPMYCSFDIECYSVNHNSKLPDPKANENEVFQIAMIFGKMGSDEIQKTYLLTRFNPYDIEGCKTLRFKTEKTLLLSFTELIKKMDPLFFIGYNIMKFDWDYMISRADKLGILDKFLELTRIIGKKANIDKINWSSSAYKEQEFRYPNCTGRTQLDVLIEVERNFKLPTYSLNVVAGKFLGEQKDDISPRQLFMFYKITKELLPILEKEEVSMEKLGEIQKRIKEILPFRQTHGVVRRHRRHMLNCSSQAELTKLVRECLTMTLKYCRQDTILPIKIIEKLNLLTTMEEMSNVMHIPMSYLHTRGQQIKVLAQVFRETIHNGIIIPHHRKVKGAPKENYEGAIVAEAHAGDYANVGTLDFCITGDTPIATQNGYSIPLKNITKNMRVNGWDGNSYGWYSSEGVIYKGKKETVKVWLQDGTTVECTPDHKFMLDNGEWCRADELKGKYVKCGLEQPLDIICEKEGSWEMHMDGYILHMKTEQDRENALAFSRLLGYILSDGSIYETTDKNGRTRKCCEVSMGTLIDAEDIMKDIVRFNVPRVTIRKRSRGIKGTTYCITIPAKLSKAIHSIDGIVKGKRATQPMFLPSFILEEGCPKSIQREFLAGLFGGDGTAPFYQKGRHSSFGPLVLKWTTIEKYKDDMMFVFYSMKKILEQRFGISSERLSKKVAYGESSIKPKDSEGENGRWDISIALSTEETRSFHEKIGFRYCINKTARLVIASSFYKRKDTIRDQVRRVHEYANSIRSEKTSDEDILNISREAIFSKEPALDELSYSTTKYYQSRKETKLRIEHITTEDYIENTRTEGWFNMGKGDGKYAVSSDSLIVPSFRKKVIGVFDNGVQDVYDIFEVEKVHNFLAGGIQASNCSLYPTTMIAFNICYSTLITDPSVPDEKCHILKWASHVGCVHDPKKRKKKDRDGNDIVICGEFRHRFLKVKLSYDEETKTVHRENEGVMPRLERNLLASRSEVKKEMLKAEARLKMTRGEASEDDLAFYRFKKFEIIPKGHLSEEEEKKLDVYAGVLNAKQLAIKVSANSTSATTPIPCLVNGKLEYRYIEELFDETNFETDEDGNEVCRVPRIDAKVWSDKGWSDIKYVFRHKISRKDQLKRVITHTGIVDVTEDHSLLDQNKKEVTVNDVELGDELFHYSVPLPEDTPKIPKHYIFDKLPNEKNRIEYIFNEIINEEYSIRLMYFEKNILSRSGRVRSKNSLVSSILFYLLRSLGYKVAIISPEELEYSVSFDNKEKGTKIVSIFSIAPNTGEYVYDIETSSHHFAAGVGDLIVHNSAYGALGAGEGFIPLIAGAASVTAMGRDLITSAIKKIRDTWSNCKAVYGDSVTGDTPITIRDRRTSLIHIIPISQFSEFLLSTEKEVEENWIDFPLFKLDGEDRREKERIDVSHFEIWGNGKWFSIRRLIRHKVNKKIYRVQTGNGVVDVTEDHSLLTEKEEMIKPKDVNIGDRLLTSFPQFTDDFSIRIGEKDIDEYSKNITTEILNSPLHILRKFMKENWNYWGDHKKIKAPSILVAQKLFFILKRLGENIHIGNVKVSGEVELFVDSIPTANASLVCSNKIIYETYDDYVYDIETESGQFHAGLGEIILKNTDSCMLVFENSTLKESFDLCKKASRVVTHHLKSRILGYDETLVVKTKSGKECTLDKIAPFSKDFEELEYPDKIKVLEYESIPTDLSFECMYGRFLLLTKKRYIAYKVNEDGQVVDITKKGVVLSRRDNSPFLKVLYKYVSDGILNMKTEEEVMYTLYDEIHKLFTRRVPDTNLIVPVGVNKLIDYAKKKKYSIGEKEEVFYVDKNGDPIEEPNGPLDPRLVYPNLPQVLLSLKMIKRGTDVPPNTRLEQIFLENGDAIHQGDKAEDYTYYKENRVMEGLRIDFLHYIEKIQTPIMELLNVKYPRTVRVHYEKIEDAVKRVLNMKIKHSKQMKIAQTSSFAKEVPKYKEYYVGWNAWEDKELKKKLNRLPPMPSRVYLFKSMDAKVECVLSSYRNGGMDAFSMDDPVEAEIIEVCRKYKAKCILDRLCSHFKSKKRTPRKPTQTGAKVIKNTGVYIKMGEYAGKYGFVAELYLVSPEGSSEKRYEYDIQLEDYDEVVYRLPREYFTTYHLKDSRIMKDIYDARFHYKKVVEEFKDLANPVILPDDF